jgi:Gene product 88
MISFKSYLIEAKPKAEKKPKADDVLWFATTKTRKLTIPQFNLPAGGSCPSAGVCKSKAIALIKKVFNDKGAEVYPVKRHRDNAEEEMFTQKRKGKYWDDAPKKKYTREEVEEIISNVEWTLEEVKELQCFICYAITAEIQYGQEGAPLVNRHHNMELLNKCTSSKEMRDLILKSIKADDTASNSNIIRLHTSGDFFDIMYLDAWIMVARRMPNVTFYGYTKSLDILAKRRSQIPDNMHLTASYGGKNDALIDKYGFNYTLVVDSVKMAHDIDLPIDIDDTYAVRGNKPFAMLLHGKDKGSFLGQLIKINDEWKKKEKENAKPSNIIDDFEDDELYDEPIDIDEMLEQIGIMITEAYNDNL